MWCKPVQGILVRNDLLPLCYWKAKTRLSQRIISLFIFRWRTQMLKKCLFPRKHFMQERLTTAFSLVYHARAEMSFPAGCVRSVRSAGPAGQGCGGCCGTCCEGQWPLTVLLALHIKTLPTTPFQVPFNLLAADGRGVAEKGREALWKKCESQGLT